MKPLISYITLGVDDLQRSLAFYRDLLGFPTDGIVGEAYDYGAVVFFKMTNGQVLALWERKSIAADCGVTQGTPDPTAFMLAHNVSGKDEVDQLMNELARAGTHICKPARKLAWGGYGGVFQDPDQHLWEVVYNPNS
ncbi:VOC family protein [Pseudidiomarina sp.]|uniref:VOC family protein n=1 Tax=Pseudidiomarina sp. TaxID=2081707 RepID=UPI00299E979D|nr:VOC family protein [Pseudidiomarina sp.]MDX1706546.1 VOC family protein [Pseudidiomarina sp.]